MAVELADTRLASAICDREWRLVWVSDDLKVLLREEDEGKLGYGKHIVEAWLGPTWSGVTTEKSRSDTAARNIPRIAWDTPGGKETLTKIFRDTYSDALGPDTYFDFETEEPPPFWNSLLIFLQGDLPPADINSMFMRLHKPSGEFIGHAILYGSRLPARLLAFVARGDESMFARMARLYEPGRQSAAVLFADLEASGPLARRLSSAAYFMLIRGLTTKLDEIVIRNSGIVAKHAGDGVTAFFLAADAGSPSLAARGAIRAALESAEAVRIAAERVADETGPLDDEDLFINVAAHWGPNLYMGQLVTGGRLEVTALGDEVNECARIQQAARKGEVLASKSLIEQLDDGDAAALEITPASLRYRMVAELRDAPDKSVRDAGGIPVVALKSHGS